MIKQDVLSQPTHPCGVRHEDFPLFYVVFFVSTHAPLRGATSILESLGVDTDVSTHAPLRGATCPYSSVSSTVLFQPTHPCGVRLTSVGGAGDGRNVVSTHAPLRGATLLLPLDPMLVEVSTHAPLRGATTEDLRTLADYQFQPTHPCGVRQLLSLPSSISFAVSTHAPLRGATRGSSPIKPSTQVSTHAPLRGATVAPSLSLGVCLCFNPRTPAGCDTQTAQRDC